VPETSHGLKPVFGGMKSEAISQAGFKRKKEAVAAIESLNLPIFDNRIHSISQFWTLTIKISRIIEDCIAYLPKPESSWTAEALLLDASDSARK
jgi:hypothetical protein